MGQPHAKKNGARSKIKRYKRSVWLCNRDKDLDQVQDEFELAHETGVSVEERLVPVYNDELPGGGQFYCAETAKHFIDAHALSEHKKTKFYKRRCRDLKKEKYTQGIAEWAAGKSKEVLPPAHAASTKLDSDAATIVTKTRDESDMPSE